MTVARVVAENDRWSILIPGLPVAADGATLDHALQEMIAALRSYAEDWADHLRLAPNHAQNSEFVRIVASSSDEQLRTWLLA